MFNLRRNIFNRLLFPGGLSLLALVFVMGTPGCSKDQEMKQEIFRLRETVAELNRNVTDAHVRLEEMDNRLYILQAKLEQESSDDRDIPAHLRKVKLVPESPAAAVTPRPKPVTKNKSDVPYYKMVGTSNTWKPQNKQELRSISERYQAALALYRQKKYDEAVMAFDEFAQSPKTNDYTDNAVFWSGVCRYEQRKFSDAIVRFQHLMKMPGSNKQADGLYYLGLSYQALGDSQTAGKTWQKLNDEFPESEAARKVRSSNSGQGKNVAGSSVKNNES